MKLAAFDAVTSALNAANTRYLVAGGVAVTAHGYIRITTEIELVLAIETGHTHQAFRALAGIGYRPTEPVDADTFARTEQRQRLRQDKGMQVLDFRSNTFASTPVGLLVQAPFDFPREYDQAMRSEILPGVEVRFLSIPTLIRMKQATSSLRDLDDIQHLQWLEEDEIRMHECEEEPNWSNATFEGARREQLRRAGALSVRQRLEALGDLMEVSENFRKLRRESALKARAGTQSETPGSKARLRQID